MKRILNTSPFLLLLVPVFMMMVLTFVVSVNPKEDTEMVVKPSKTSTSIAKQVIAIFK